MATINVGKITAPDQRAMGEWVSATTYLNNNYYIDTVIRNGNGYICVAASGTCAGIDPLTDTTETYWKKYVGVGNVTFTDYSTTADADLPTTSASLLKIISGNSIVKILEGIKGFLRKTLTVDKIINSLNATVTGNVLDATQGKALDDKITTINTTEITSVVTGVTMRKSVKNVNISIVGGSSTAGVIGTITKNLPPSTAYGVAQATVGGVMGVYKIGVTSAGEIFVSSYTTNNLVTATSIYGNIPYILN